MATFTIWDPRPIPAVAHVYPTTTPFVEAVKKDFPSATMVVTCGPEISLLPKNDSQVVPLSACGVAGAHYTVLFGAVNELIRGEERKFERQKVAEMPHDRRPISILCAVDEHKPAVWAARWALSLARQMQSQPEVTFFHAVDGAFVVAWEGEKSGALDHFAHQAKEAFGKLEAQLPEHERKGVIVHHRAVVGDPADCIVEAALDFDLLVIGTHGRHGLKRAFFGSVCTKVLRHTSTPAVSIRYPAHVDDPKQLGEPAHLRRILAAVGPDESSVSVLDNACFLSNLTGANVKLLHVLKSDKEDPKTEAPVHKMMEDLTARGRMLTGSQSKITVDVVHDAHAAEKIQRVCMGDGCDLIVMATHGRTGIDHFRIGSVCEQVCRDADCPVLVVGPGKKHPDEAPFFLTTPLNIGSD